VARAIGKYKRASILPAIRPTSPLSLYLIAGKVKKPKIKIIIDHAKNFNKNILIVIFNSLSETDILKKAEISAFFINHRLLSRMAF
jgi:hypothetical protein